MDTMMLVNEQSELLAEATAEFLDGSSLNSDDNLIALKGFLRTRLESAVAWEGHCFYFPYMFIWGGFGKTDGDYGGLPNAILWWFVLTYTCSLPWLRVQKHDSSMA